MVLKIAVYGIGKMGLPLALAFAEKNHDVTGIDVNAPWVEKINQKQNVLPMEPGVHELLQKTVGKTFRATTKTEAAGFDVVILLVPTLIHEKKTGGFEPDLHIVQGLVDQIASTLKKGTIVITECTLPPGTTEKIGARICEKSGLKSDEFGLAHCPERTSSGTAMRDIRGQYPKIIGANDPAVLDRVAALYESINPQGVIRMSSISAAECVKVFEGVYRDVNIALANELARYCQSRGLDAFEIFKAANSQPFCHLHQPSCGVGGHCIPYYPYFVMGSDTPVIAAARKTNDAMPKFAVDLLAPARGDSVGLLGLTFRGGVKEFRKSPALDVAADLKNRGVDVYAMDPLCSDDEIKAMGFKVLHDFSGLDGLILTANHKSFATLDWPQIVSKLRKKIVLDGCNALADPSPILAAGGTYLGVGKSPKRPKASKNKKN